jgi:chemotaxis protein methyltransferase CheR
MRKYKITSFLKYLDFLDKNDDKSKEFVDKLTINVTEFFRNPEKWKEFESKYFPYLYSRNSRLKIFSAGCSSGEEPYTMAIILDRLGYTNARITARDLDLKVLAKARQGIYDVKALVNVDPKTKENYFRKIDDKTYQVVPKLKAYINFGQINLLQDRFDKNFDLIVCRNVVIYFNQESKDLLYRKFFDSLKPGGLLFVGSTERIFNYKDIGFQLKAPFIYIKPEK